MRLLKPIHWPGGGIEPPSDMRIVEKDCLYDNHELKESESGLIMGNSVNIGVSVITGGITYIIWRK